MKKGFSLLEFVITFAIIAILISFFGIKGKRMNEKKDVKIAKQKIVAVLDFYKLDSYNIGEEYEITFNFSDKTIIVKDSEGEVKEKTILPKSLTYITILSGEILQEKELKTNSNGGLTSFSVYLFNGSEELKYRIAVDGINKSKLAHINVYENKNAEENLVTIKTYSFNKNQWTKE